ncbi:MAG: hypothetical protein KBC64_03260 [Simkaniaceae bacterium]|nr:hypothetical protein [Simkaniaceae bacterium]
MAPSLFAIALLSHPLSLTPPEYGRAELSPVEYTQEKSEPSHHEQIKENPSSESPPIHFSFPAIATSPLPPISVSLEKNESSSTSLTPFHFVPPSQSSWDLPVTEWSLATPSIQPIELGASLSYPSFTHGEENSLLEISEPQPLPLYDVTIESPLYTPPADMTPAKEDFDLKIASYTPPMTTYKNQDILAAPSLPFESYSNYDHAAAISSSFFPKREQEHPFLPPNEQYTPYNAAYPYISRITLSSHEPPLPPLFQYLPPAIEQAQIDSLLQNYSSKEYNLSRQPSSDELNNVAFDDQFDVDVGVTPRADKKGYLFHINLYPKANLTLHHMKQNFVFVIDKSSSIKEFRYEIFRKAVLDSLDYLQEGDTFNIYVVDNKKHKLSSEPLLWRKANVRKAREFLFSQDFNKFYSSSADTYDIIEAVQEEMSPFEGELTIILVTDGSSLMDIKKRKHTLSHLIYSNKNSYTLHTACMSKDSSGSMLDLLSTFNRGEFITSQTHAAFPRKFCRLVKHVSQIITKDIHLSTLTEKSITLFPSPAAMPQMYVDRPFVIYGMADELEDFDLIVQGKFDDRYLFMKKKIRLKTAPRSTKPLQKQLAIHQAYLCYQHYLTEHNEFYLEEAKKMLSKYKLRAAVDKKK